MRTFLQRSLLTAGILSLLGSGYASAGDLFHRAGRGSDCGCSHAAPHPVYAAPVVHSPGAYAAAVPACCGAGGGLAHVGNLYGLSGAYGDMSGFSPAGGPAPDSFLSGYEGLPNMDGGGIHHRYPYHSYRRPWAHPGTPSTNVTIVW